LNDPIRLAGRLYHNLLQAARRRREKMSDLTTKDLRRDISRVKREVDKIDRAAHGMTFEELIRLLAFPKKGVAADELLSDQDIGQTGD
jgi:hypothetical protein